MKVKDYNATIDILDSEVTDLVAKLGKAKTDEEYKAIAQNLKLIQESKQLEVRNKNEHLAGKIPPWCANFVGMVAALIFGDVVLREEHNGGVVSSQAISLWDKVIRKF